MKNSIDLMNCEKQVTDVLILITEKSYLLKQRSDKGFQFSL